MVVITIGNKKYTVQEAKTEQDRIKGLQGKDKLPKDEGMLFYFDPDEKINMWMSETKIPLDIIFINEDYEVTKVYHGKPYDKSLVTSPETAYVLEVNEGSGIKVGEEVDIDDGSEPVMKVLASDGSTQMELWGGERIFRRTFTKQLIRLVKQAEAVKYDETKYNQLCKRIGRKMFKEIKAQDARKPEYVQVPNS